MSDEQLPTEQSDILKAGAARCAKDRWICWFCGACIPRGEEKIVAETRDVQVERRGGFYVKGAEGLTISCGCRS